MIHRLLFWASVAVLGAGCSSNATSPHCWYEYENQCVDYAPQGADAGVSISIDDAGTSDCTACLTTHCTAAAQACNLTDTGAVSCALSTPAYATLSSCLGANCASSCVDGVP